MNLSKASLKISLTLYLLFFIFTTKAQDTLLVENKSKIIDTEEQSKKTYPKFKVGGVFQARYLDSFKRDVDVEGLNHSTDSYVQNTFEIKRMRISMNANLSDNLSVVTLVNLADFKSDPKTRVLENAYAQYKVSKSITYQVGQFRPAFGMEDSYPVDIVKSIDFSNSYYLLGSNGWQSFQIGAAISGRLDIKEKIPFHYAISMTNGNGKNKIDNNNGKHYAGRFYFDLNTKNNFKLGVSAGIGDENSKTIYALGVEGTYTFHLSENWSIEVQSEGFKAINQSLYFSTPEANRLGNISDYILKGAYVLPSLKYVIGIEHLHAIDLSMRYEYLDANSKLDSNPRQTWVPMISVEFQKNYGVRLQAGVQIDNYRKNIPNTKIYNADLAFLQFQCRLQ